MIISLERGFGHFLGQISRGIGIVQGVALLGITGLILLSIVLRNIFGVGLVWVFEAAGFLMVTLVFIGVAKNMFENEDIRVDFVTSRLPMLVRKVLWISQKLVVLGVSVTFSFSLFVHAQRFGSLSTPTLGIPHYLYYCSVLIGPALASIVVVWQLFQFAQGKVEDDRF